jgi:hypothetical protein
MRNIFRRHHQFKRILEITRFFSEQKVNLSTAWIREYLYINSIISLSPIHEIVDRSVIHFTLLYNKE